MSKAKVQYLVEHSSGREFTTYAVSEQDAINHIHFKLWFQDHIWTEMSDFSAVPMSVLRLREIKAQEEANKKPEKEPESHYHQISLFEVAV